MSNKTQSSPRQITVIVDGEIKAILTTDLIPLTEVLPK